MNPAIRVLVKLKLLTFFYVKLFNRYLKLSFGVLELIKDFSSFNVVFVGFYYSNDENPFNGIDYLYD